MMAKNLRKLIEEKRLSITELSRRSKVPAKTIYHWMNGQQPRKMEHLFSIADVLEVTVEELFGRESKKSGKVPDLARELALGKYEIVLRPLRTKD
ncbi:hypothetical protein BDW_08720 [Bdellovibrio bacteriovorus W]|nr:hypothetical protein BDW_08720 [Bdellovibrio bacteriovorus W]